MKFSELTPEEKLYCAIKGEPAILTHFLSKKGTKAVNDLLDDFIAKHPRKPRHFQPAESHWRPTSVSREFCERGVKVLRLRFGFEPRTEAEKVKPYSSNARTPRETAVYFGVTRERIRQIEARTLRMLRHPIYRPFFSIPLGRLNLSGYPKADKL